MKETIQEYLCRLCDILSIEEKTLLLLSISKITADTKESLTITFCASEFFKACEELNILLNEKSLEKMKKVAQGLANKSIWVPYNDGSEVLYRFIYSIDPPTTVSNQFKVKFTDEAFPFLLDLYDQIHCL